MMMKKLPYDIQTVVPGSRKPVMGSHSAEFLAISPAGQVPVIQDNGFILSESNAILCYLADKYQWCDLYPPNPFQRALVHKWLHFHHTGPRYLTLCHVFPKMFPGVQLPAELVRVQSNLAKKSLAVMDIQLAQTPFLTGASITLADIALFEDVCQCQEQYFNVYDFSPHPHVKTVSYSFFFCFPLPLSSFLSLPPNLTPFPPTLLPLSCPSCPRPLFFLSPIPLPSKSSSFIH